MASYEHTVVVYTPYGGAKLTVEVGWTGDLTIAGLQARFVREMETVHRVTIAPFVMLKGNADGAPSAQLDGALSATTGVAASSLYFAKPLAGACV